MRFPWRLWSTGTRRAHPPATIVVAAFAALVAAAIVLPAGAPAGQSSQATSTPLAPLATGRAHSCAALVDATLRCWGFSGDGQVGYGDRDTIGDNETPASVGPVNVGAGGTVRALAAGDYHSCSLLDNGSVRCWGFNYEGQLGYGNRDQVGDNEAPDAIGPVNLGAGRTATAISAGGRHTCAVLDDGSVRCWGLNEAGQLGYGNTTMIGDNEAPDRAGPVEFGSGRTATSVTAGGYHTCAILDDASVRCWGLATNGQLGYGGTNAVLDPGLVGAVDLGADRTARAITAGDTHTCAVLDDGSVRCWGLSDVGQLGYGNTISIGDSETPGSVGPVDLGAGRTAIAISAGAQHTCAVLDDGGVRCWGLNEAGQLGYGNTTTIGDNEEPGSIAPVDLGTGRTAKAISGGLAHTCARLDDDSVRCWGFGGDGRLGYCNETTVGDDEAPGSAGPVDLGAGGQACPAQPAPPPPPPPSDDGGSAPPPAPAVQAAAASDNAEALRAERARAQGLRACRAAVARRARTQRSRALRRYRRSARVRTVALRRVSSSAARGRARCLSRFGRRPGRVTTLAAGAGSRGTIVLTFRAAGSDGSRAPAARSYLVKQSLRPIRSARDFRRAAELCDGACTFDVTEPGAEIELRVTQLRRNTRYYYVVAARDNVSRLPGPRSRTVSARTR